MYIVQPAKALVKSNAVTPLIELAKVFLRRYVYGFYRVIIRRKELCLKENIPKKSFCYRLITLCTVGAKIVKEKSLYNKYLAKNYIASVPITRGYNK